MERTGSQLWQDDSIGRIGNPMLIDPLSGTIRLDGEIGYGFRVFRGRGLMTLTGGYSMDRGPVDRQTAGALFDIGKSKRQCRCGTNRRTWKGGVHLLNKRNVATDW